MNFENTRHATVKYKVCKTFIRRFDSDPRLQQNQQFPHRKQPLTAIAEIDLRRYRLTEFAHRTGPKLDQICAEVA